MAVTEYIKDASGRVWRKAKTCTSFTGLAIILLLCLICFCCSVSSSFAALFWKRKEVCAKVYPLAEIKLDIGQTKDDIEQVISDVEQTREDIADIAESFRSTAPCSYRNNNNTLYVDNAYRNRNQNY